LLISDYIDLVKQFTDLLIEKGIKKEKIDSILDSEVRPHSMFSKIRTYRNIVEGRFNITDVIRIERKNDEDTISNKTYDFSFKTINHLLNQGYSDSIEYGKKYNQNKNKEEIS
jgi:NTE family protein